MLDIAVFTNFLFTTDFLMLGIIFLGLNLPFSFAVFLSILFGMLKDAFMFNSIPVFTLTFIFTVTLIEYLLWHVRKKAALKFFIVFLAVAINLIIGSAIEGSFSFLFAFSFLAQSLVLFLALEFLLKKWMYT